nr:MAG TPA: hypothetical protein [Caudoviricetes sp.]
MARHLTGVRRYAYAGMRGKIRSICGSFEGYLVNFR